jgi:5'-3' exonuclease
MRPILIDAENFSRRHLHASALDDLKSGIQPTGGIFGTLRGLVTVLNAYPERGPVIACFDQGYPEHRRKLIPEYKQNRVERREQMTEEDKQKIFTQLPLIRKMLRLLGVAVVRRENCEADDLIYYLAGKFQKQGCRAMVISSDKDLRQCARVGAIVLDPWAKVRTTRKKFFKQHGVRLDLYVLFRALVGDPSDNIKGVHGCGESRARQVLWEVFWGDACGTDPLTTLVASLRKKKKRRKFEDGIIAERARLRDVMEAIDLSKTPVGGESFVDACIAPQLRQKQFLKFCRKFQMRSVTGDPSRFIEPFKRAVANALIEPLLCF